VESEATVEAGNVPALRSRTRTCVGCGARVDALSAEGADLIRLILGPDGEIAVGGSSREGGGHGIGRGAHVHARRGCVERAAKAGLLRATKGTARTVADDAGTGKRAPLNTDSLARAIQGSMDHRIEGLLTSAVRSRQAACGAGAVTGQAELVLVATDAFLDGAAADLTGVRRAVAEGRAVAWGTRDRLGAIVAPGAVRGTLGASVGGLTPQPPHGPSPEGVGVVVIASRRIAEALRQAVQSTSSVISAESSATRTGAPAPVAGGASRGRGRAGRPRGYDGAASGPKPRAPKEPTGPRGTTSARDHRSDG